MKNTVCAVIITYNCDENFLNTFNSVVNQVGKIVIVDNGSNKNTINMLKNIEKENDVQLILCEENLGIAAALNKGVKYALNNGYDWIITLDHDSNLKDDMVMKLLKGYNSLNDIEKEKVVSLLPRYIELGLNVDKQLNKEQEYIKYIEGGITSGNIVSRKAFEEVGLFDEKLFIDFVDYDFCFRIKEHGYDIVEVSDAILFHRIGETKEGRFFFKKVSATNHSPVRRYYITRNRIYCWKKYKNIVPESIKFDKSCALKETIKILLYEEKKFNKIKMIFKGIHDSNKGIFGKFD